MAANNSRSLCLHAGGLANAAAVGLAYQTEEHPTKFELVINRRTAKAIGLTIQEPLLHFAGQVTDLRHCRPLADDHERCPE